MVDANQNGDNAQKELNQPEAQKTSSENSQDKQQVEQESSSSTETQEEKLLKQSDVNKIVGAAKLEAREQGRREAQATQSPAKDLSATVDPNDPNQVLIDQTKLEEVIERVATQKAQQTEMKQNVDQFVSKLQLGMQRHSDFETTVAKLNLHNLPYELVRLVNALDNTADIVYELGKSPSKFSSVLNLCNVSPQLAYDELTRLSDSIKKNQQAATSQTKVNEPLDQVKPSTTGTDNGELKSVKDYQKLDWMRG